MERITALIPNGFPHNGSWIQQAELRQLNGHDEQLLAEIWNSSLPLKTTALLERIVTFGKSVAIPEIREIIRSLTVGDRVALMLHLRKLTFGDKLSCVLTCPDCKESMSLELSTSTLLQPTIPNPKSEYSINLDNFTLTIRPVNGADLEAIIENSNKPDTAEQLVKSCIISSEPPLHDKLSDDFIAMVSSKLQELDPQANLELKFTCPTCQHSFQAPFNAEDYIFQEITEHQKQLEREVHWLAFNYHWSENSILSLPLTKRKRYVELINATLSGENI